MRGLLSQVGMGLDSRVMAGFMAVLAFCGVALVLWLLMLALSRGKGPRLPRTPPLPWPVRAILAVAAAVLWAACAWGFATRGPDSELARAALPFAVAFTIAAASVIASSGRPPGGDKQ